MIYSANCGDVTGACNCGDTVVENYTMTYNLNCTDYGLIIGTNDLILDCVGYSINFSMVSVGNGIGAVGLNNVTIRNCNILMLNASMNQNYANGTFFFNTNNSKIENTSFYFNERYTNGISLYSSKNNTVIFIDYNTTTDEKGNALFLFSSSYNTFSSCNINISGNDGRGIIFSGSSSYNNFTNITLYQSGSNTYGIIIDGTNNSFSFVSVKNSGSHAIMANATYCSYTDINISTDQGAGLYLFPGENLSSYQHNISNFTVNNIPAQYYAPGYSLECPTSPLNFTNVSILGFAGCNNIIIENTSITKVLYLNYVNDSIFTNVSISTKPSAVVSTEIYNNTFSNFNITTSDSNSFAVYGINGTSNRYVNFSAKSQSSVYLIYLMSFVNNSFNNFTIAPYTTGGNIGGIYLGGISTNNNFSNFIINTTQIGKNKILLSEGSANNTFENMTFLGQTATQINSSNTTTAIPSNNIFLNITNLNKSAIMFSSNPDNKNNLTIKWYIRVNVTNHSGDAIGAASVNSINNQSITQDLGTTGDDGNTTWFIMNDSLFRGAGNNITYSMHSFTVNKTGYISNTTNFTINDSMTLNIKLDLPNAACGDTITSNLTLNTDLNCTDNGLIIGANDLILDCAGHYINFSMVSIGNGIAAVGRNNITIKNCIILQQNDTFNNTAGMNGTFFLNTNYSAVTNLTINTMANYSNGVSHYNSNNFSFSNISIETKGYIAYGFYFNASSTNNTLFNFNITTNKANGVCLVGGSNNILSNFSISTNASGSGAYLLSSSNNILSNFSINTSGMVAYGAYLESSSNNILSNFKINTSGIQAYGADIVSSSTNNTLSNFFINTTGSNAHGIEFISSSNNNLSNFNIFTNNSGANGAYLWTSSNYNLLSNFNITTNGTQANGVLLASSSNNTLFNFNISTTGSSARGTSFTSSPNNTLSNFNISTTGSKAYGAFFFSASDNNTLFNFTINTTQTNAPKIGFSSSSNLISNSTYLGQSINQTYLYDLGDNTLLNITNLNRSAFFYYTSPTNAWNVTLQWYARVNVTDMSGTAIDSASVSSVNNQSITQSMGNTAADGNTSWYIMNDTLFRGAGGDIVYSTHEFTASKTGYLTNSTNETINESKTVHIYMDTPNAACGDTITENKTLNTDLNCTDNGLIIGANDLILDCAGHAIEYARESVGNGIAAIGKINVTIKNCRIFQQNDTFNNTAGMNGTFFVNSNYSLIENTTIQTLANYSFCMVFRYSEFNNIQNVSLSTQGFRSYGIYIRINTNNNSFSNINITTNGSYAYGTYLYSVRENNLSSFNISTNGSNAYAVFLYAAYDSRFEGFNIQTKGTGGYGIYYTFYSSDNLLKNFNISTSASLSPGVYFRIETQRNNLTDFIINTSSADSPKLIFDMTPLPEMVYNNRVINTTFLGQSTNQTYIGSSGSYSGENMLLNITNLNRSAFFFYDSDNQNNITVQWYVRVNVTDHSGTPIGSAAVSSVNNQSIPQNFGSTQNDGNTSWIIVNDTLFRGAGGDILYSTTNITASKAAYAPNTTTFTLNDSLTLNIRLGAPACGQTITGDLTMGADMNCSGDALTIGADNLIFDCAGHAIQFGREGNATGIEIIGRNNVTMKSCRIYFYNESINVQHFSDVNATLIEHTNNSFFENITFNMYGESVYGMRINNSISNSFANISVWFVTDASGWSPTGFTISNSYNSTYEWVNFTCFDHCVGFEHVLNVSNSSFYNITLNGTGANIWLFSLGDSFNNSFRKVNFTIYNPAHLWPSATIYPGSARNNTFEDFILRGYGDGSINIMWDGSLVNNSFKNFDVILLSDWAPIYSQTGAIGNRFYNFSVFYSSGFYPNLIYFENSNYNVFENFTVSSNDSGGLISLSSSSGNIFKNFSVQMNASSGNVIGASDSSYNLFYLFNVTVRNITGIYFSGTSLSHYQQNLTEVYLNNIIARYYATGYSLDCPASPINFTFENASFIGFAGCNDIILENTSVLDNVLFAFANNSRASNITMRTNGFGLRVAGTCINNSFSYFNISAYMEGTTGLEVDYSSNSFMNNSFSYFNISMSPSGTPAGFSGTSGVAMNNNFSHSKLYCPATSCLSISGVSNFTFRNITAEITGSDRRGFYLSSSPFNVFTDFNITNKGTWSSWGASGIYLYYRSNNNTFYNGFINTTNNNVRKIIFYDSSQNNVTNVTFFGNNNAQTYIYRDFDYAGDNIYLNATNFNKSAISYFGTATNRDNLTVKWYVRLNITKTDGTGLEGASGNYTNNQSRTGDMGATTGGLTSWIVLNDTMFRHSGGSILYLVHNFTANRTSYNTNSTNVTVNQSMTVDIILGEAPVTVSCGDLINRSITMANDINCSGTGLIINNDSIVLDCAGHYINYSIISVGNGIEAANRNNITIKNCIIYQQNTSMNQESANGTFLYNTSDSILFNISILTREDNANALFLNGSSGNTIYNITISTTGWAAHGALLSSCFNNSIFNFTVSTTGQNAQGAHLGYSFDNSLSNFNVTMSGMSSYGAYFYSSFNNSLSNFTISSTGTFAEGVFLGSSSNNSLSKFSISTSRLQAYGVFIALSSDNALSNFTISTTGWGAYGAYINGANNNSLSNFTISSTSSGAYGVYLSSSLNNSLSNFFLNSTNSSNIYIDGSTLSHYQHNLTDVKIRNIPAYYYATGYSLDCPTTPLNFTNGSFIGFAGCLDVVLENSSLSDGLLNAFSNRTRMNNVSIAANGTGLRLANSTDSVVSNISISTTSYSAHGSLLTSSSNNSLSNFTISITGGTAYGIYLDSFSNNNTLSNFTISSTNSNAHGASLSSSSNNTLSNFTISTTNMGSSGILLSSSSSNSFSNFNISTTGWSSSGAYIYYSSSNNSLSNFMISTTGYSGHGAYISEYSSNNSLSNFIISTIGDAAAGAYILNMANNNSLSNFTISTTNTSSSGAYVSFSHSNSLSNFTISTANRSAYGAYFDSASYNLILSSSINTSNATAPKIYLYGSNSKNTIIANCSFLGQTINQTYIRTAGNNFLINITNLNRSAISYYTSPANTWNVTLQWYVRLNVTDTTGSAIESASGNYTNNQSITGSMGSTTSGLTAWYVLNDTMFRGAGGDVVYTMHNFTANKTGYITNSTNITVNATMTVNITLGDAPVTVSCGDLINRTITMANDINCSGTGLIMNNNSITLDCAGHAIGFGLFENGTGIAVYNKNNVTIKNCRLFQQNESDEISYLNGTAFFNTNFSIINNVTLKAEDNDIHGFEINLTQSNVYGNISMDVNTSDAFGMGGSGLSVSNSSNSSFMNIYSNGYSGYYAVSLFSSVYNNSFYNVTCNGSGVNYWCLRMADAVFNNSFVLFNSTINESAGLIVTDSIFSESSTYNNTFRNFKIQHYGTATMYALDVWGDFINNTLDNFTIYNEADLSVFYSQGNMDGNSFSNFFINEFGPSAPQIFNQQGSDYNVFSNFTIYSNRSSSIFYFTESAGNIFDNFTIFANGSGSSSYGYGENALIYFIQSPNNVFNRINFTRENMTGVVIIGNLSSHFNQNFTDVYINNVIARYYATGYSLDCPTSPLNFTNASFIGFAGCSNVVLENTTMNDTLLLAFSNNSIIRNITIQHDGSGLFVEGSLINNSISQINSDTAMGYGIYIRHTDNPFINNSFSYLNVSMILGTPLYITGPGVAINSNFSHLRLYTTSSSDSGDYGLRLWYSSNLSFFNLTSKIASSFTNAAYLYASSNNTFNFFNLTNTGTYACCIGPTTGIYAINSHDNHFFNGSIETSNNQVYKVYLTQSMRNNFTNVTFLGLQGYQTYIYYSSSYYPGNNIYLNITNFNKSAVTFGGTNSNRNNLTVQWYVRLNITDSSGAGIDGASGNYSNNQSRTGDMGSATSGLTSWIVLNDTMFRASGGNILYRMHNFTANKTGYIMNSTNVTVNQTMTVNIILGEAPVTVSCGDLINRSITMANDINCSGTGLIINNDSVVLDCAGHYINFSQINAGDGIRATGKTNITIRNCTILQQNTSMSQTGNATFFFRTNNSKMEYVTITTLEDSVLGFSSFNSINNNLTYLNITASGYLSHGFILSTNSNNNTLSQSNISSGTSSANYVVYISTSANNTVKYVWADGPRIYLYYAENTTLNSINITTVRYGITIDGIYFQNITNTSINGKPVLWNDSIYSTCPNDQILNFSREDYSMVGLIGCRNVSFVNITMNQTLLIAHSMNISVNNFNFSASVTAIQIANSSFVYVNDTNISTNVAGAHGIYVIDSQNISLNNGNITVSGNGDFAIYLLTSSFCNVSNQSLRAVSLGGGLELYSSGNNTITDSNLTSPNYCLDFIYSTAINNILSNLILNSTDSGYAHVHFYSGSGHNNLTDITFAGQNVKHIYLEHTTNHPGNITFVNPINLNKTAISYAASSDNRDNLTVQWYARVNVTDYNGNPISGASANSTNNQSITQNFGASQSNGLTDWIAMNDTLFVGDGNNIAYALTNFTANKTVGGTSHVNSTNVTVNDSMTINIRLGVPACGQTLTENTTLDYDLNCSATGLIISANDLILDCAGHAVEFARISEGNGIQAIGRNNITIKNCRIFQQNDTFNNTAGMNGTWFFQTNNSIIRNVSIFTLANYSYALALYKSKLNIISNTSQTTYGRYSYNTYLLASQNNSFSNVTIITNGSNANTLYVSWFSGNNSFSNYDIFTNGTASYGVYVVSATVNSFNNITIATNGSLSFGVTLAPFSNNNTFNNISIATIGDGSYGIYLRLSSNNSFNIFNITTKNTSSYGIYMRNISILNTFTNFIISTNNTSSFGMLINYSSNNTFNNFTITTTGSKSAGIYLNETSENNTLNQFTINTSAINSPNILIQNCLNLNMISNITLLGQSTNQTYLGSASDYAGSNILLNITNLNRSAITYYLADNRNNITLQWYIKVNVSFTNGTPISGASVNATNNQSIFQDLGTTGADGLTTSWAIMNDTMFRGAGGDIIYSTTNFTAQYGFMKNSTNFTINDSQTITIYLDTPNIYCGDTITTNLTLNTDLNCSATAITIGANDLILDCAGHAIEFARESEGNGIQASARKNVTIKNCRIFQQNNTFNNTDGMNGTFFSNTSNSSVFNTNISTWANYSHGFSIGRASNSVIKNISVFTYGAFSEGFEIFWIGGSRSNYLNIDNLNLTTIGNFSKGFHCYGSYYSNISNLNLSSFGNSSYPFYMYQECYYGKYSNFTVFSNSSDSDGVIVRYGRYNLFDNFTIKTNGSSSPGIYFYYGDSNNFSNINITTEGSGSYGINPRITDLNNFDNISILTSGSSAHGINVYQDSNGNSFNNIKINTTQTNAYHIRYWLSDENTTITNVTLLGQSTNQISLYLGTDGYEGTFIINATNLNRSAISFYTADSIYNFTIQWYVKVNVSFTNGTPISGASVNATNNQSIFQDLGTTGADGLTTSWAIMNDTMFRGAGGDIVYSTTNFTVNYSAYSNSSNFTINDSQMITIYLSDTQAPSVFLEFPENNNITSSTTMIFNCSGIDDVGLSNITLFIWNSTNGLYYNNTKSSLNLQNSSSWTLNSIPEDLYNWTCNSTDLWGNTGVNGTNRTFKIDTSATVISLNSPTNRYNTSLQTINFNCSATDSGGLANITIFIWNSSYSLYYNKTTPILNNDNSTNWTLSNIPEGRYNWTCNASDASGNNGFTVNYTFTIDLTPPFLVQLVSPQNNLATALQTLSFNCSGFDNFYLSNFTLIIWNSTQTLFYNSTRAATGASNYSNWTVSSIPEGVYNWTCNGTDNVGNGRVNGTNRTFTIDLSATTVVLNSPENDYSTSSTTIEFNCSGIDSTGLANITLFIWNSTNSLYYVNTTEVSNQNNESIWSVSGFTLDTYNWTCNASDVAGNEGYTSNRTFTVANAPTPPSPDDEKKNMNVQVIANYTNNPITVIAQYAGSGLQNALATLTLNSQTIASCFTNSSGTCQLGAANPGVYYVKITRAGYNDIQIQIELLKYGCASNNECNEDEICKDSACTKITGDCGYAKNHVWISYECCSDAQCASDYYCTNNKCNKIVGECGYISNHKWIAYECCKNSDCASGKTCINNKCEGESSNGGGENNASCVREGKKCGTCCSGLFCLNGTCANQSTINLPEGNDTYNYTPPIKTNESNKSFIEKLIPIKIGIKDACDGIIEAQVDTTTYLICCNIYYALFILSVLNSFVYYRKRRDWKNSLLVALIPFFITLISYPYVAFIASLMIFAYLARMEWHVY